ncbi:MAG: M1 family aminopeptidase [Crocinitomicaceae bacterium]
MKTIRYTQNNVHDFAWFADKRYAVLKGEVELPQSKRKVMSWAMFVPSNAKTWQHAIEYINDGTYYYSLWNGDYPYNQVTAVDGTISAGGGMEYPNVTVIGNASSKEELEVVIVHEVGHNWFYGILGSNERVHGWMDEGMNTLNEMRYIQTKYPNNTRFSDMVLNGKFHLNDLDHHDMGDISYRAIAGFGLDQPIETHSAAFTSANYGIIMYQKTGLVFFYLKDYLGEELFDKAMHEYYEQWKFKHPQPEDMKKAIESSTGKNLSWLFTDLIQTTRHVDYKIQRVKKDKLTNTTQVTVKNVGQVQGPIEVNTFMDKKDRDSMLVETKWAEPAKNLP